MNMEKEVEVEVVATNEGNGDETYLRWIDEMDGMMFELLKEQKLKGKKDDKSFLKAVYREVAQELKKKFGGPISHSKVTNRLKTLKEQMYLAIDALNKSGIWWNDVSKNIEAEPEVWNELIKAKDKLRTLRGKKLIHLEIFQEIFEKDRATENNDFNAKDRVKTWRKENSSKFDDVNEETIEKYFGLDSENSEGGAGNRPSYSTSSAKGKKRKASSSNSVVHEDMQEVSNSMKEIARAIMSTNRRVWNGQEMFEALKKLGLEGTMLLDAVDWLVEHPNLVGTFFAYPEDLRMEWLQRKMRM